VLIFDEVLSGFRMCPGGGQEYLGITPDLSCLSKAVGGSVPMAAIVGRREVMRGMLPIGKTNVSGTYTGHLLSVMGAVAALEQLREPDFYPRLNANAERLYAGINEIFQRRKIKAVCQGLGARFGIFFGIDSLPITDFRKTAGQFDAEMDKKFISMAFARGLYFRDPGRRIVPGHHGLSSAHTAGDIDETLNRLDDIFVAF
jgi:glutamate-1-semialdehyde 2,1-aminomutase